MMKTLSPTAFRAKLAAARIRQIDFAKHLRCDKKTINRWALGQTPVPHHIALTIDTLIRQCKEKRPGI